ncbi:MAG: HIT family protein [Anaerolineae bacterium]|nr:HIT family protein [Anaerolineae bacterium]
MFERFKIDFDAYHLRAQTGPCFICEIIARNPDYPAHIVYEDEVAIAFLDKYPPLYGHTLVAPQVHKEQVTADFTLEEYIDLQRRLYRIAEAVRQEVGAERVYLYAFGSNQGNAHVHWHVAPLPPGVPYRQQQITAIRQDPLRIPEEERVSLAVRIRRRIEGMNGG